MDRVTALTESGYNLRPMVDVLRGAYHRERGEHADAKRAFAEALASLPPDEIYLREPGLAGLAETHLAAGELEDARRVAEECIRCADDPAGGRMTWRLRAGRVLALVESASGQHAEALERLDALVGTAEPIGSPSTLTELFEARARVALASGDREAFHR